MMEQTQKFDAYTRWYAPCCALPGVDSFHKTIYDGLPWDSNTPPAGTVVGFFCLGCCSKLLIVSYPSITETPYCRVVGDIREPTDALLAAEKSAFDAFAADPRDGVVLSPSSERDRDWSGGCLATRPAPPMAEK